MNEFVNEMADLKASMQEIIDSVSIELTNAHKLLDTAVVPDRIGIKVTLENHPLTYHGSNLKSVVYNGEQIGVLGIREQHGTLQMFLKVHGVRQDTEWIDPRYCEDIKQKVQDLFDYFCLIVIE